MLGVTVILAIVGFGVGILINALSDAMPRYRRPRLPEYPDGTPRPFIAWSGTLAYLTKTHINETGSKLTLRHPITEIFTALLFAWIPLGYWGIAPARGFVWLVYLSILLLITVIDIEHRLILFPISIPALGVAFMLSMLFPDYAHTRVDYMLGAGLGFGIFGLMFFGGAFYGKLRGISAVPFGFGDVVLAGLCGMMIGFPEIVAALFWGVMFGGIGAVATLILSNFRGKEDGLHQAIPYGPFIVLGAVLYLLP